MENKKTFLVLGSSGQIGSALVKYLRSKEQKVIEFDIVNGTHHDLRLSNNLNLESAIKASDFIYFLAFDVGGSPYLRKYQKTFNFLENNVLLMQNTFRSIKNHNKPFIFASSQMSTMTHSAYGSTKMLGEFYTKSLNGLVVKFWNIYGPEKDVEKFHVIPDLILKARDLGKIELMTDGMEYRQFLHVYDCCECLFRLYENYNLIDRDKNLHITSFEWTNILTLAYMIIDEIGKTTDKNTKKFIITSSDERDTIQNEIKVEPDPYIVRYWRPKITLQQGLKKMVDFYFNGDGKKIIKKWKKSI